MPMMQLISSTYNPTQLFNQQRKLKPTHKLPTFTKLNRTISPTADPTKTRVQRAQMVAQLRRRYLRLVRVVRKSIITEDSLGLKSELHLSNAELEPLPKSDLSGLSEDAKIRVFMAWFTAQTGASVLERIPSALNPEGIPWITKFMKTSYGKGVLSGNIQMRQLIPGQLTVVGAGEIGTVLAFPQHVTGFQLELNRTWTNLKGITDAMNSQVQDALTVGLEGGLGPRQIARNIADRIDKIGLTRSEMVARTEVVRAQNLGSVHEFERAGDVLGEPVLSQWQATLDDRVRDNHLARHGKIFKTEDAVQLLGEPNCRCALLPYIESVEGKPKLSTAETFTRRKDTPGIKSTATKLRKKHNLRKIADINKAGDKLK